MKLNGLGIVVAGSMLALTTSPLVAHHSFPRASDTTIAIEGTVTKFEMRNPHSRLTLDVRDSAGRVTAWDIELGSIPALVGRGWQKDSLKPGDVITVDAIVGSMKANLAAARDITMPGGRVVFAGSHAGDKERP
jgi:hypothetical protein